jgi:hypothetical protein
MSALCGLAAPVVAPGTERLTLPAATHYPPKRNQFRSIFKSRRKEDYQ